VRVRDRLRANASSHHLSAAGAALLDLIDDEESSEETSDDSGEHSDYEPATKHSVTASVRELPGRIRKTPVEKVKYGAGYNYGVPGMLSSKFYITVLEKMFHLFQCFGNWPTLPG
jgi:hypothetical protein